MARKCIHAKVLNNSFTTHNGNSCSGTVSVVSNVMEQESGVTVMNLLKSLATPINLNGTHVLSLTYFVTF